MTLFKSQPKPAECGLFPYSKMKTCKKCGSSEFFKNGNCAPCQRIAYAKWHDKNRDRVAAKCAKWRNENRAQVKAADAARAKRNSEGKKKSVAKWRIANPEARRIHDQNRRSRKRSVNGVLSKGLTERLFSLQKGFCPCCGKPLGNDFHLDHIIPLALGGQNIDHNIQLLRAECNLQKQATHPIEFMQSRGFLL